MGRISEIEDKKHKSNNHNVVSQTRTRDYSKVISTPADRVLSLQGTVGNQAVQRMIRSGILRGNQQIQNDIIGGQPAGGSTETSTAAPQHAQDEHTDRRAELLTRASAEPGKSLDDSIRAPMEHLTGVELGNVRVHAGKASEAAAESLGARAYTIGSNIYLGSEASNGNETVRRQVLSHEAVHTVQQGGRETAMQPKMRVSSPGDAAEAEADKIAKSISGMGENTFSPTLALRDSLRGTMGITAVAAGIQRDITGKKKQAYGEFEINFKKNDATAAGAQATEDGTVKFTPSATAPESSSIRFVQIVRTVDVGGVTDTAGANVDWSKVGAGTEAPRNQMVTKLDTAKNVASGFYVDQIAAALSKRTKKSDSSVLPYYDAMLANPGNQIGTRKGKTIVPAILDDHPGFNIAVKFNFVTSAKASDTGVWYGTVLWGFETYLDKGVAKIKGEYHSFRGGQGETTDAALKAFDEYYRNPGASTAPKK